MNSHEYRKLHQRRRSARLEANLKRKHPDLEAERLIELARKWAPYGGISEEETLVHFGMTAHRFIERLWEIIPESTCTQDEIRSLAKAYLRHRPTNITSFTPVGSPAGG